MLSIGDYLWNCHRIVDWETSLNYRQANFQPIISSTLKSPIITEFPGWNKRIFWFSTAFSLQQRALRITTYLPCAKGIAPVSNSSSNCSISLISLGRLAFSVSLNISNRRAPNADTSLHEKEDADSVSGKVQDENTTQKFKTLQDSSETVSQAYPTWSSQMLIIVSKWSHSDICCQQLSYDITDIRTNWKCELEV